MGAKAGTCEQHRVVLIGFGAINARVAALLSLRDYDVSIVGIATQGSRDLDLKFVAEAKQIRSPTELVALKPDLVVEAASGAAVREWGAAALECAPRFVITSTNVLADDVFFEQLKATARKNGSQIVLSPGALGGIDALAAARCQPIYNVLHRIQKPAKSWPTGSSSSGDCADGSRRTIFTGSARQAASSFPLNANCTVASAMAGIGLDQTRVELISDPDAKLNQHEIFASGAFGTLSVKIENNPLATNPKSSELAALSLVRVIDNTFSDVVI